MNFDMADRNSAPEEFACIWQSKRVGVITIETEKMWILFSCDFFVAVSCRGILNSLMFTKAWLMQAWIPVVSSGLYFWKSFRGDSILKWRVYIKLKVSWLRAFLWCMGQTNRDRVNSRRVRNHEKNSGDVVRRLGTIVQSIFVPNQAHTWKLSSPLFSRPDWLPLGLRRWSVSAVWEGIYPAARTANTRTRARK